MSLTRNGSRNRSPTVATSRALSLYSLHLGEYERYVAIQQQHRHLVAAAASCDRTRLAAPRDGQTTHRLRSRQPETQPAKPRRTQAVSPYAPLCGAVRFPRPEEDRENLAR